MPSAITLAKDAFRHARPSLSQYISMNNPAVQLLDRELPGLLRFRVRGVYSFASTLGYTRPDAAGFARAGDAMLQTPTLESDTLNHAVGDKFQPPDSTGIAESQLAVPTARRVGSHLHAPRAEALAQYRAALSLEPSPAGGDTLVNAGLQLRYAGPCTQYASRAYAV